MYLFYLFIIIYQDYLFSSQWTIINEGLAFRETPSDTVQLEVIGDIHYWKPYVCVELDT